MRVTGIASRAAVGEHGVPLLMYLFLINALTSSDTVQNATTL